MLKVLFLSVLIVALSGCGKEGANSAPAEVTAEQQKEILSLCIANPEAVGIPAEMLVKYCACLVDEIVKQYNSDDITQKGHTTINEEIKADGTTYQCALVAVN
jgi:hypothetical protein